MAVRQKHAKTHQGVLKLIFDEIGVEHVELRSGNCTYLCKKTDNGGVIVNMGKANTNGKNIPISLDMDDTLNFNYNFEFKDLKKVKYMSVINVGNPSYHILA